MLALHDLVLHEELLSSEGVAFDILGMGPCPLHRGPFLYISSSEGSLGKRVLLGLALLRQDRASFHVLDPSKGRLLSVVS
eukprot:6455760-Amphidinium_carterae.1